MRALPRYFSFLRGPAIIFAWFCCGSLEAAGLAQQIPQGEYEALVAFYNQTNGKGWHHSDGWLDPAAENWYGVFVEGVIDGPGGIVLKQGHVITLAMPVNAVRGTLPAQLDQLFYLQGLILWVNELTGPIPPQLAHLQRLTDLNLSYNHFTGPIPSELGNLGSLESLDLSGTPLQGPLPPDLGNLSALKSLLIENSLLDGTLPPELGNLKNLQVLDLNFSRFSGSIPPELGNLSELWYLDLNLNRFTSAIPPDLGRLNKLVVLKLAQNQLSGTIPKALGNLPALTILALGGNNLSGSIPAELADLQNVQELYLAGNKLTGSIPPELGRMAHLNLLTVADNQLTGSVPQSLGDLPELQVFDVSFNNLSGDIPDHFASPGIFSVNFSRNNFDLTVGSRFQQAIEKLRAEGTPAGDRPQNGPNRLLNISGRARVGGGDNVLIVGFTLQGASYDVVTVRGLGPSLLDHGLTQPLSDPFLAVYGLRNGLPQILVENDDWVLPGLNPVDAKLEPKNDRESALVQILEPGAYTAIVSGKNGNQGVGLMEVFAPDDIFVSEPVNFSVRGAVGSGDEVLIGGFVIGPLGPGSTTIVLRGMGPSLAQAGVGQPLPDPVLELRGPNGDLLAMNDSWKNGRPDDVLQTGLAPSDDREAALIAELGPGGYTAILRGANATTGIGLIEIYNVK